MPHEVVSIFYEIELLWIMIEKLVSGLGGIWTGDPRSSVQRANLCAIKTLINVWILWHNKLPSHFWDAKYKWVHWITSAEEHKQESINPPNRKLRRLLAPVILLGLESLFSFGSYGVEND